MNSARVSRRNFLAIAWGNKAATLRVRDALTAHLRANKSNFPIRGCVPAHAGLPSSEQAMAGNVYENDVTALSISMEQVSESA